MRSSAWRTGQTPQSQKTQAMQSSATWNHLRLHALARLLSMLVLASLLGGGIVQAAQLGASMQPLSCTHKRDLLVQTPALHGSKHGEIKAGDWDQDRGRITTDTAAKQSSNHSDTPPVTATQTANQQVSQPASHTANQTANQHMNRTLMDPLIPALLRSISKRETRLASISTDNRTSHYGLPQTYLAICAIVKNDAALLHEWLLYHHDVMGVRRFYIFDNNSTYSAMHVARLQPWIAKGVVVYEYFVYTSLSQGGPMPQSYVVEQCTRRWYDHHEWIAFIDPDEFFVLREPRVETPPPLTNALRKLLPVPQGPLELFVSQYEGAGGLSVNWMLFGSSGHINRTPGTLGYYTECVSSSTIKTIASMHFYDGPMAHPHNHHYFANASSVDEDGHLVGVEETWYAENAPATTRRIALFHYYTRSRQDWARKMQRGRADCVECGGRDWAWFHLKEAEVKAGFQGSKCDDLNRYKDMFTLGSSDMEQAFDRATKGRQGGKGRRSGRGRNMQQPGEEQPEDTGEVWTVLRPELL